MKRIPIPSRKRGKLLTVPLELHLTFNAIIINSFPCSKPFFLRTQSNETIRELITFISLPDFSFPDNMSSRKLSTILMVILGPKSDTNNAYKIINTTINHGISSGLQMIFPIDSSIKRTTYISNKKIAQLLTFKPYKNSGLKEGWI